MEVVSGASIHLTGPNFGPETQYGRLCDNYVYNLRVRPENMMNRHYSVIILLLIVGMSGYVLAGESEDRSRIWEKYASHTYSNLNAQLNGELTPIFRSLGDFGELQKYFDKGRNPKEYEAYGQLLVEVLSDALRGHTGNAILGNVLLELTPTHVLLPMIAPEIGPKGKLHGLFDGKGSAVAKKIEGRSHTIYEANVTFDHYVSYLKGRSHQGYSSQTNADIIVEHMFRTEPQKAFISMLWADYGFLPYARGNCYLYCKKEAKEVRRLQQALADITDYMSRQRYSFPISDKEPERFLQHLKDLSHHSRWWVRLYVACLMEQQRAVTNNLILGNFSKDSKADTVARIREWDVILEELSKDSYSHVANAIARIREWQKKQ